MPHRTRESMAPVLAHLLVLGALLPVVAMRAFAVESIQNGERQSIIGLQELRSYLRAFGYLNDDGSKDFNLSTLEEDEHFESALKIFQKNYSLNVTRKLDSATSNLLNTPRCGVPDDNINRSHNWVGPNKMGHSVHIGSHYSSFRKWPPSKYHLTYTVVLNRTESKAGMDALFDACSEAFQLWAQVSNFTFELVRPGSPADLLISFERRDHGDGSPFDGPYGVLAHSSGPIRGKMHVDADENWTLRPPSEAAQVDLVWVVIHEIGHLLGLGHSTIPDAVMYAYIDPGKTKRALHSDDIAAIQALYSKP